MQNHMFKRKTINNNNNAIVQIIIGALGPIALRLKAYIKKIRMNPGILTLQKSALPGTAFSLRDVLSV